MATILTLHRVRQARCETHGAPLPCRSCERDYAAALDSQQARQEFLSKLDFIFGVALAVLVVVGGLLSK